MSLAYAMELTDVPGVGAAKADKLRSAGITNVKQLAEIDLRRPWNIGIGDEVLKRAKQEARKLCDKEGIPYAKASYGNGGSASPKTPEPQAVSTPSPKSTAPAGQETQPPSNGHERRRGLLARIFRR